MAYLDLGSSSKHRHYEQDQVTKTFSGRPSVSTDIPGKANLQDLLAWTRCLQRCFGQDQVSADRVCAFGMFNGKGHVSRYKGIC